MLDFKSYHLRYLKSFLFVALAVTLVIMLIVLALVNVGDKEASIIENTPEPSPSPTAQAEVTNKVKIQLAGDVVLNSDILSSKRLDGGGYDFDACFSQIKDKLDGDLCIFNLEGILNAYKDGSQIAGAPIYNYPREIASALKNAGFDYCVTANDRAAYFSDAGIKNNVEHLIAEGLTPVGTSVEGGTNFVFKEINGIRIAILAYTDKLVNEAEIDTSRISTLYFADVEGSVDVVSADVKKARDLGAEIIIASLHWGNELVSKPDEDQRELADKLVRCGVDVVYGTMSHVFQDVTYKNVVDDNGESKNAIIAYSMGNLLSHPTVTSGEITQQSGILNLYVERDSKGKAYISSAECMPIYIYARALENNEFSYFVLPASDYASVDTKPGIFGNDEDWQRCKDAYAAVKATVEASGNNGMPLGLK